MAHSPVAQRFLATAILAVLSPLAFAETITVPPCGNSPGTTAGAYTGLVQVTVSGLLDNTPGNPLQDAFYNVDPINHAVSAGPCQGCFRYNRVSEGSCLCSFECAGTSHPIESLLAQPLPAFEPSHTYTVLLDLGLASPEALHFAMADCGCGDNMGAYTVTIEPASTTTTTEPATTTTTSATSTSTMTTSTTIPADSDADGVPDHAEGCVCAGTATGAAVTTVGCSVDQACPCAAPHGRTAWNGRPEFRSCVREALRELRGQGRVTEDQRHTILSTARSSRCGAP